MSSIVTSSTDVTEGDRAVGTIGLVSAVGVAVILGVHPFGTTDMYDDGQQFLEHVGWFWIAIHFLAAPLLFGFAPVVWRLAAGLTVPAARMVGYWAAMTAVGGMAVGALHLVGTDTVTFFAFTDTFNAAGGGANEAAALSADLLLRLHAATLVTWIVAFWFMVPLLIALALYLEGDRPVWMTAAAGFSALCQVVAVALFLAAGQHTTASETGFFRIGVTVLVVLIGLVSWNMRRGVEGRAEAQTATG